MVPRLPKRFFTIGFEPGSKPHSIPSDLGPHLPPGQSHLVPSYYFLTPPNYSHQPERKAANSIMAEEHRCQVPDGHRLCANNCGFLGSPTTMNLCSKCYGDITLKEQQESSIETVLSAASTVSPINSTSSTSVVDSGVSLISTQVLAEVASSSVAVAPVAVVVQANRCATCRKRVGLTGFKCRCGVTFCGSHRYPEKHACNFDFKKVGREEIARANPLIRGEKLQRI